MKNRTLVIATSIAALAAGTLAVAQTSTLELSTPTQQVITVDADGNATVGTQERGERGDRDCNKDKDRSDRSERYDDDNDADVGEEASEAATGADDS